MAIHPSQHLAVVPAQALHAKLAGYGKLAALDFPPAPGASAVVNLAYAVRTVRLVRGWNLFSSVPKRN